VSYNFSHDVVIECPECQPAEKRQRRPKLECSAQNYSGCGEDMGTCPECGKTWAVSFRVDKLKRAPEWDVPPRASREAEREAEAEANRQAAVLIDVSRGVADDGAGTKPGQ